ncbi:MAG: PIN domain-containing protein [Pyrinomonadaceae bacterium]
MKRVFVDSLYIVALINPNDQWREKALQAKRETADAKLVTTEIVLIEVLNFLSEYGANLRRQVSLFVRDILEEADFEVISYMETTLLEGLELYDSRLDKGYGLTDCISMNVCRELNINGNSHARPSFRAGRF